MLRLVSGMGVENSLVACTHHLLRRDGHLICVAMHCSLCKRVLWDCHHLRVTPAMSTNLMCCMQF